MKKKIKIGKPYIEKVESDVLGKAVRLCAEITMDNPTTHKNEAKICYYEFEEKYERYLCPERSDAFVIGLLTTAMENNMDIEFETPISERLYYQLMTYYIPMVSKYNSQYPMYNIQLIGKVDNTIIKNEKAVATGCSGGVDSFYTMSKHLSQSIPNSFKLTHIVFSSNGFSDYNEKRLIRNYKKNLLIINKIAKECDLELISCYNNLCQFYQCLHKGFVTFFTTTYCSVAFALQKLISVYYASSGTPIEFFNIDILKSHGWDGSAFDIFTLFNLNTENLSFYSTGVEVNRNQKIEYISNFIPAQNNLVVCGAEISGGDTLKALNCSKCKKCLRTMFSLYVINKLDLFGNVFDINFFQKNLNKNIGKIMAIDHKDFTAVSLKYAKENNVKISFISYIYCYCWYKPIKFLRKIFSKSLLARKLYYKLNLDYKLDGYRGSAYEAYKNKINK